MAPCRRVRTVGLAISSCAASRNPSMSTAGRCEDQRGYSPRMALFIGPWGRWQGGGRTAESRVWMMQKIPDDGELSQPCLSPFILFNGTLTPVRRRAIRSQVFNQKLGLRCITAIDRKTRLWRYMSRRWGLRPLDIVVFARVGHMLRSRNIQAVRTGSGK